MVVFVTLLVGYLDSAEVARHGEWMGWLKETGQLW